MMHISCPPAVSELLRRLDAAGHEAYLVGGSLRDSMLGRPPHDWDITTSALPEETLAVFADWHTVPTGLKHGTVTVLCGEGEDALPVEITTYRVDGDYLDSRHPSEVSFTRSLGEDLARRDFTVCAMAWSPYAPGDGLVDLFDGRSDLAARVIRCVREPEERFREDALRILRAYRFAAELSFTVEPATRAGARACARLLARISAERVCAELSRTVMGENADAALAMMEEDGILVRISPEAVRPPVGVLPALPCEVSVRLSAIFRHLSPDRAAECLERLRLPGAVIRRVSAALSLMDLPLGADAALTVRRLLRAGGECAVRDMLDLRAAFGEEMAAYRKALDEVLTRGDCTDVAHLALNGSDLAALGIPRGPGIGKMLSRLLDAVIADPSLNERERLHALACSLRAEC